MNAAIPPMLETITPNVILDAYRAAYRVIHGGEPDECHHLEGDRFRIDGNVYDRRWLIFEVERLRQAALTKAVDFKDMKRNIAQL